MSFCVLFFISRQFIIWHILSFCVKLCDITHYKSTDAVKCPEISAVDVQIVGQEEFETTTQNVQLDRFSGFKCNDSDNQPEGCYDHQIRFCCEGCCPQLNVSGDPELTDYYEDYPGTYQLIYNDTFNDRIYYRQIAGYDEVGDFIWGQGRVRNNNFALFELTNQNTNSSITLQIEVLWLVNSNNASQGFQTMSVPPRAYDLQFFFWRNVKMR